MTSKHYRSAREHLARADALAAETDEAVETLGDTMLPQDEAAHIVSLLGLATARGALHARLAEVHIALAGCPVD